MHPKTRRRIQRIYRAISAFFHVCLSATRVVVSLVEVAVVLVSLV